MDDLPDDCMRYIAEHMGNSDRCVLSMACKRFRELFKHDRTLRSKEVARNGGAAACIALKCPKDESVVASLVEARMTDDVVIAIKVGYPLGVSVMREAIKVGDMELAWWVWRNGGYMDASVADAAADKGEHVIRWLLACGCPADIRSLQKKAARCGNTAGLKVISKSCLASELDWRDWTNAYSHAFHSGNTDTAEWIDDNFFVDRSVRYYKPDSLDKRVV